MFDENNITDGPEQTAETEPVTETHAEAETPEQTFAQPAYVHPPFAPQSLQPPQQPPQPPQPPQPQQQQPYIQQPYTQAPPYAQQPYAPPHVQQQYTQQPYGHQPYAQAPQQGQTPPTQSSEPSPYSQYAQAQYGQPQEPKRKKEKVRKERVKKEGPGGLGIGRRNTAILVAIIVAACAASGIGGGLVGAGMTQNNAPAANPSAPAITITPKDDITTTEAVAKKALSSVVGIESTGTVSGNSYFFGPSSQEVTGVGTGMIIDVNGYILTNSHVVMDGSVDTITVHLSSGDTTPGTLVWNDPGLDLAIVKVDVKGLTPVEFGDSDNVAIGSYIVAIGNPLGLAFSGSVTQGVVSGLNRTITVSDGMGNTVTMQDLIQVDAAINSGNSGGPLLNSSGQVIGVNTAKAQAEGMGFAIPINTAMPIVEKVLKDGNFERVFMGVSAADVSVIKDNYPNVNIQADSGAVITDVNPGSPAEKAGLKVKDVITSVDGTDITGSDSLIKLLLGYTSGDTINVTFNRDGEIMTTQVTLLSQAEIDQAQQNENPFRAPTQNNSNR